MHLRLGLIAKWLFECLIRCLMRCLCLTVCNVIVRAIRPAITMATLDGKRKRKRGRKGERFESSTTTVSQSVSHDECPRQWAQIAIARKKKPPERLCKTSMFRVRTRRPMRYFRVPCLDPKPYALLSCSVFDPQTDSLLPCSVFVPTRPMRYVSDPRFA